MKAVVDFAKLGAPIWDKLFHMDWRHPSFLEASPLREALKAGVSVGE